MDYGKTAYLKVSELEARLADRLTAKPKNRTGMNFRPFFDFATGDFEAAEVSADETIAIIVKAEVRADSDISGAKISMKLDGIVASESAGASLTGGERYDFMLLAALDPGSGATLSLSMDGADCTLLSCQLVVSGTGAKLRCGSGDCAADKNGNGKWLTVTCEDDDVAAYIFDESEPLYIGAPLYVGTGRKADCAGGDGDLFVVAYVDVRGNAYVATVNDAPAVTGRTFIADGVTAIAIGRCGDGYIIAEIDESGAVACRYLSPGGGISMPFDPGIKDAAVRVGFVKNAERPTLIVGTSERSYVKYLEIDYGGSDEFAYTATVTLTPVKEE